MKTSELAAYVGAVAVVGLLAYLLVKRKPGESIATTAGREVVTAAGNAAVGGVKGIGGLVGIPDTNEDQCSKDLAAGNYWAASFSCPASRYLGEVFTPAPVINDRQIDRIIERQTRDGTVTNLGTVIDPETGFDVGAYDEMGNRIY